MSRHQIFKLVDAERVQQDEKWGHVEKDVTGWLLVIEAELNEAKQAWVKQTQGKHCLRNELIQVAASAVAALELE